MALLVGEFETQIDAKHRLAIPFALRELIDPDLDGTKFYLVLSHDWHLLLYPDRYYRTLVEEMERSPLPGPESESASTDLLWGTARMVKPDKQGRIVIPEKSLDRSVVGSEVTLVGQFDHIHIWPREAWEKRVSEGLPTYGKMLQEASARLRAKRAAARATET